jgi:hypothetical protein
MVALVLTRLAVTHLAVAVVEQAAQAATPQFLLGVLGV